MYRVIKAFADLQDVKKTKSGDLYHEYEIGDEYPRKGLKPSEERIAEISGSNNLQKTPLIELIEEEEAETPKESYNDESRESGQKKSKSGKKCSRVGD